MSKCTCGDSHDAPADEEVVEAEKSEALDEPIAELDKHEELYKDMEATLGKLKEVMAYLESQMGDEKMDHEEKAEHEDEEEEEETEKSVTEKADDIHKSLTTLKKYGINIYSGSKATPAPAKNDSPKVEKIDFNKMEKSFEDIEALYDGGM